ncbi:MAG: phosphatidylglycerophosphatase A [Phycisphaerae bacterium]|nr:phosphatidylglycerophosphatase A [Phycisphaerae bacterium]
MSRSGDWVKTVFITVLGSGFAPLAPGTWGSLVAVVLFMPVWFALAWAEAHRAWVEVAVVAGILLSSWISVGWGAWAIKRFGRKDPRQFVLDEFAGQWVALLALPIGLEAGWWAWAWVVGGQFFLFRLFDVLKPPPARQAERLRAGWGILADDLIAGFFAIVVGQLFWRLAAPRLGLQLIEAANNGG